MSAIGPTILLSSAGRRGALVAALRDGAALAGASVRMVATDCSTLSAAAQLCDVFHQVPRADAPGFIEAMLRIAELEGPLVVVPTIDTELSVLAESRKRFLDVGSDVVISSVDTIEICSDKARSSEWLRVNGFPVPRQYAWDEVVGLPDKEWPLFFKPKQGSSSVGAQQVNSLTGVAMAIERYGDGVLEELVDGDEFTVDCWVDAAGHCLAAVPRLRLAVRAGEVSKAVTTEFAEVQELAATVCETLPGAFGPITIQVIVGADGPRVIEINPRFGGGYPLTHRAGGTYTAAIVAEALNQSPDLAWFAWEPNVTMLRYDEAVFLTTDYGSEVPG